MKSGFCLAAIAAACLWIGEVHASGPIAVYALVDKVTFEPNADHPQQIHLAGVFILSSVPEGCGSPSLPCDPTYSGPQKGYLDFTLPAQYADQALHEWADVKAVAGTGQVIAFGTGWAPNLAKVRAEGAPAHASPWPPFNVGVRKVTSSSTYAQALLEFHDK